MSIDSPHGGSSVKDNLVEMIFSNSEPLAMLMCELATSEKRECTGGAFALYDEFGVEIKVWTVGACDDESFTRYMKNAINKCLAMYKQGVVCSGMVATSPAETDNPVYDGGIQLENGWYLSFSGFPAEYDRVLCIVLGDESDVLNVPGKRHNTIMQFGPNPALVQGILHSFIGMRIMQEVGILDDPE